MRSRPSSDAYDAHRDASGRVREVAAGAGRSKVNALTGFRSQESCKNRGKIMSSPVVHAHHAPQGFIRKYVFSLDHKVIGIQYYFLGLFSVLIGMTLSVLMRFHMVYPDVKVALFEKLWPTAAQGGVMTPELYLSLMTMHGTIMVFFVLTTVPQSGFGNYFLP